MSTKDVPVAMKMRDPTPVLFSWRIRESGPGAQADDGDGFGLREIARAIRRRMLISWRLP